jgi:DNA-binding CsgD family transcriptional regulator
MLTARQLECLLWVKAGKSSTDIGAILGLSAHTVNERIAGACDRLGVRTRTQAVAEAMAKGLLPPSTP